MQASTLTFMSHGTLLSAPSQSPNPSLDPTTACPPPPTPAQRPLPLRERDVGGGPLRRSGRARGQHVHLLSTGGAVHLAVRERLQARQARAGRQRPALGGF